MRNKLIVICCLVLLSVTSHAAGLVGNVSDDDNQPVAGAVISLMPLNRDHLPPPRDNFQTAKMDQWQKQYVPYNLPVLVGTHVSFPNKDNIKHHVYSFSRAKRFELKLYSGVNAKPVLFDSAGVVVLGCNIHDWMLGYIYVLETPYFAKTDETGGVVIEDLPDDDYVISVWHPRLRGNAKKHDQQLSLQGQKTSSVHFTIKLKRERHRRKSPDFEVEEY